MNNTKTIFLLMIIGLTGCVFRAEPSMTPKPSQVATAAIPAHIPSETPFEPKEIVPTLIPAATQLKITPVEPPKQNISLTPLVLIEEPLTQRFIGSAVLVSPREVRPYYQIESNQIELLDLSTDAIQSMLTEQGIFMNMAISPDGKWLAYLEAKSSVIVNQLDFEAIHIVAANGQEKIVIPWKPQWGAISGWIDNDRLIIRSFAQGDPLGIAKWLLNPFTGIIQELPETPKDVYNLSSPWLHEIGIVSYSPDLRYRLYLNQNEHLVLEELNTSKSFEVIPNYKWNTPRWSPDGQDFILASTLERWESPLDFYRIFLDGTIIRLTNLDQYDFHTVSANYEAYSIDYFSWSPDGKKIAFWMLTTQGRLDQANLAVLNLESHEITLFPIKSSFRTTQMIVWSPDGQRLLTGIVLPDYSSVNAIMIDILEGWYTVLAENATPVGWMIND